MPNLRPYLVLGLASLTPFDAVSPYRGMTPFVVAILALLWLARGRVLLGR